MEPLSLGFPATRGVGVGRAGKATIILKERGDRVKGLGRKENLFSKGMWTAV